MKKIMYRLKQGCGSHRMNGKMYVAGDMIKTNSEELRGAIDKFKQMEETPSLPKPEAGLSAVKVKDGFDVVNDATGKVLNDKPLNQNEASAMAYDVNPDEEEARAAFESEEKDNASDGA